MRNGAKRPTAICLSSRQRLARARPDHVDEKAETTRRQSMGATPFGNRREPAPVRLDDGGAATSVAGIAGEHCRETWSGRRRQLSATASRPPVAAPDTVDCASDVVEQDLAVGLLGSATATLEQIDTSLQRIARGHLWPLPAMRRSDPGGPPGSGPLRDVLCSVCDAPGTSRLKFRKTISLGRYIMLRWALTFLVVALVAGLLGFWGLEGVAMEIARVLFVVFLILFIVSLFVGRGRPYLP